MSDKNHPSYGILSFSRSSISGNGVALFGSSIRHNDTIRLSISKGEIDRHGNESRYYAKHSLSDKYIEVEMSYSQFAEAITSLNMGEGVPVTVMRVNGQQMPPCPYEDKQKLMRQEFKNLAKSVTADMTSHTKEVAELLQNKKTLNNADKEFILSALHSAAAKISDHMPYINEMFAEQMEKTVTEAKGEFENFLQNKMNSIALEAIAEKQKEALSERYSELLPAAETINIPPTDMPYEQEEEENQDMGMGGMSLG
ncbi:hypothetical protein [Hungatella sp.]|uniref:hypothetical protein n=1 Tax=Hungatella sp. TaxID=2613924 RepID=UPI002A7F500F|nr:hypothetical protein [Hungatella sp.]